MAAFDIVVRNALDDYKRAWEALVIAKNSGGDVNAADAAFKSAETELATALAR